MNQDKPPLPELGPEWTPYWRNKVHAQMHTYADTCTAALSARVAELERDIRVDADSREMFVARLERITTSMTAQDVLALLNDCDMLAARTRDAAIDAAMKGEA